MLFTFVFRFGLGIALSAVVGVALIRAQHVDDSSLLHFLRQGCERVDDVCWYGIRPGFTHVDDAVMLLEAHPWIDDVTVERQPSMEYIYWHWNQQRPPFLDSPEDQLPPFIWARSQVIDHIAIPTALSYGDMLRTLGAPELGMFRVLRARPNSRFPTLDRVWHMAGYEEGQYLVYTTTPCPITPRSIWRSTVTLSLYSAVRVPLEAYDFDHWLYRVTCQV
jgi:hypothetical protein